MKHFCKIMLVALAPLGLQAEEFNFSQELNKANSLSNTIDFITSYHEMAQKVGPEDSSRLAKKLVKLIVNLHTICSAEEDLSIRKAYKTLLETAIKNEKLASVDHMTELQKLVTLYAELELTPATMEPILTDSTTVDPVITTSPDAGTTEPVIEAPSAEQLRLEKLREKVKTAHRNEIVQRLILRRVINDVTRLAQEFTGLKREIAQVSEQNNMLLLLYKKLLNIEQLVKYGNIGIRFPVVEEHSSLEKLIFDDAYPLSSTRMDEPNESFSTMK